jgi:hypothetical protein
LVGVWLASTAAGFWWFTMKDLRHFAPEPVLGKQRFDTIAMSSGLEAALQAQWQHQPSEGSAQATVLHFWDPGCACSRFNETHVRQLSASYAELGVRFLVVDRRDARARPQLQPRDAFGPAVTPYTAPSTTIDDLSVPASPAAAVFDRDGRLAYFGPYSEGAACLAGNGDFVEQVLDKLLAGERPQQINTAAFGCFCDWNHHS